MFQVIHNKCTLHIQATNCVQEREWLDTLNRLIQMNQMNNTNKVQQQPPYANNENNPKCLFNDLSIKLDPDRELARIHSLLLLNIENIKTMLEPTNVQDNIVKIWKGNSRNYPSQFIIDDRCSLMLTLTSLKDCVSNLEKNYKQYITSIIGSELSPIETDDY